MKQYFHSINRKILLVTILVSTFVLTIPVAFAALTLNTDTITGSGALNLTPTGFPVTVDGNLSVTGTCSGCIGNDSVVIGPAESSLSSTIRDYTGASQLLVTKLNAVGGTGIGVEMESNTGNINGVYFAGRPNLINTTNGAFEADFYSGASGQNIYGYGTYVEVLDGVAASKIYGFYQPFPVILGAGSSLDEYSAIWIGDQAGSATNPYYSWFNSRGVGRCKEDNTFNSVGQSICVVYNPQFTKYTAGASNYERIVYGQWNSNVAEMGVEKGGTGTLRPLRLIGSGVIIPTSLTFNNLAFSATAPTISSGFGTSPSVTANNGTAAFRVNVGTGGAATTGVVGLPTATAGWNCFVTDITNPDSFVTRQTGSTASTASFKNYSATTGLAIAWTASDVLAISCTAF